MGRWLGERSSLGLASEQCMCSQGLGLSFSRYKMRRLRMTAMVTMAKLMNIVHLTLEKQFTVSLWLVEMHDGKESRAQRINVTCSRSHQMRSI